jgi:hypothetical protein
MVGCESFVDMELYKRQRQEIGKDKWAVGQGEMPMTDS